MPGTGNGWKQIRLKANFKDDVNFVKSPYFEKGTKGSGVYNVLAYGADPTGSTDSTAAIQLCIDTAKDGTVIIPGGLYLVSTLNIIRSTSIIGDGNTITPNYNATILKTITGNTVFNISPTGGWSYGPIIKNLAVYGNNTPDQVCISINGEGPVIIDRVTITEMGGYGIKCCTTGHTSGITIKNCTINGNYGGIFGVGQPSRQFNVIKIQDNSFNSNQKNGIHISGVNINIKGNTFQGNIEGAILLSAFILGDVAAGCYGVTICDNYFESNKGGMLICEGYHSLTNPAIYQSHNCISFYNNHGTHNVGGVGYTDALIKFKLADTSATDFYPFDYLYIKPSDIGTTVENVSVVDFGNLCNDKCRVELTGYPYQQGLTKPAFKGIGLTGSIPSFFGFYDAPSNWIASNLVVTYSQISLYDLHRWVKMNLVAPLALTCNPQITTGIDGQLITIIGNSDINTLTLSNGNGLKLSGGNAMILGKNSTITLRYSIEDSIWYELSRSF